MTTQRFAFDFDPRTRGLLALGGFRPQTCEVVLDEDRFTARFGRFRAVTPTTNLRDACITRGYRAITALGPRASFADRGATFGTTTRAGVCIRFHEPIAILAGQRLLHPGLTVTVAEPEELLDAVLTVIAAHRPGRDPDPTG